MSLIGPVTHRLSGIRRCHEWRSTPESDLAVQSALIGEKQEINQEEAEERYVLDPTHYSGIERHVRKVSLVNLDREGDCKNKLVGGCLAASKTATKCHSSTVPSNLDLEVVRTPPSTDGVDALALLF
jgi:hypothetical protein